MDAKLMAWDTQEMKAARCGERLRILIVTDTWAPQVNGVVRTLEAVGRELTILGHAVQFATVSEHATIPLPTYPEIRLALLPQKALLRQFAAFRPDAVHIATEGPLGVAARAICRKRAIPFTTSFHTRFPDYVRVRVPFAPERAIYRMLRKFHAAAAATMVSTLALKAEMEARGFRNLKVWTRGVDSERFRPGPRDALARLGLALPRPVFLSVGRLAVEKNLDAFLALDLPGSKVVVGDGPERRRLAARYPMAHFLGAKSGEELANLYAAADVFVFPSRTDTFGLVILEALASGVPVAAYPVPGPQDVVGNAPVASLRHDLKGACLEALAIPRVRCRAFAASRSWRVSAEQFLANLAVFASPFGTGGDARNLSRPR